MGYILFPTKLASPLSYSSSEPVGSAMDGACQGLLITLVGVTE